MATVKDFVNQRDKKGLRFLSKDMMRNSRALKIIGQWEEEQLFAAHRAIIGERDYSFDGRTVFETVQTQNEVKLETIIY